MIEELLVNVAYLVEALNFDRCDNDPSRAAAPLPLSAIKRIILIRRTVLIGSIRVIHLFIATPFWRVLKLIAEWQDLVRHHKISRA